MNEPCKVKCVVLRASSYGDNDKMLTVLSREKGLMSVAAKGVKSLKNKNAAAANVLCYSEMVLKPKGDIYSLSSADVIESFYELRTNLEALSCGVYFASLTEMCVGQGEECGDEMKLLLNSLYMLSHFPERADVLRAVFEVRMCVLSGIAPIIAPCSCGSEAEFFDIERGECVCHLHKTRGAVKLSKKASEMISFLEEASLKAALEINAEGEIALEVCGVIEKFMRFQLGRLPKSLDYLHNIKI
ncbi:MAG: DNA repair protein RecO [Clostridia bacterium]|nr:DNA repair protein RecO [Clostridia bacterium]